MANVTVIVDRLVDVIGQLEDRIARLEYRLKLAGIKDLVDGIPDDEAGEYFTIDFIPLQFSELTRVLAGCDNAMLTVKAMADNWDS